MNFLGFARLRLPVSAAAVHGLAARIAALACVRLRTIAAVGVGLLVSTPAWALTCDEILSMVGFNIPTHIIVQTMEGSGTRFTAADVRCLTDGEAPQDIVDVASEMAVAAEREDEALSRPEPTPTPEPEEEELPGFDEVEALGADLPDDALDEDELLADSGGPERLQELIQLYRAKKLLTASKGLFDLLEEGIYPEEQDKIEYYLAKSLFDLGMYHGAQHYFLEVIRSGPSSPYFKYALPKLVAVAQLTGNDIELLRFVHKVPPEAFPRQAKNHLYYLMGRKLYEADELSVSARYFQQVSPRSELFMRSKYFEGVIHNERGKLKSAVRSFRDVYQADVIAQDERSRQELTDLRELALIDIARIYYGLERYDTADEFYALVDRDSGYWPESLFERAWTTFMQNDLNQTLGLLLTVDSPYYSETEYLPEATILRGLTFFQLCDYDEVERLLLEFEATHRPMQTEMRDFLDQYASAEDQELADQAFDTWFRDDHQGSHLSDALLLELLQNRDLGSLVRHLDLMDREVALIEAQKGLWRDTVGARLQEVIERDRLRYKKHAGQILLQEMAAQYEYLTDLLTQSEIIRFEVVDAQRLDYEYKMVNPLVESEASRRIDYGTSRSVIYWPFNGEFWKDELGFYRYTEHPSCN